MRGARRGDQRGVTISELMVALVVLTIGVLGGMASFRFIAKGISTARTKTIVANLAQEKMEVLKNVSYAQLLVTTATLTDGNYTPNIIYDSSNYPAETITLYGYPVMRRSVYVAYATTDGNAVSTVPYTSNDTGLKEVVVDIAWQQDSSYYKMEVRNLVANPNAASLDSGISGNVKISGTSINLSGALVQVLGSPQWQAFTDAGGNYSFQVANGTYSLVCSSTGYSTQTSGQITVYRGTPVTAPTLNMVQIATGTVSGDVWISSNLVISGVVASSGAANIEFVELFNPTTYAITIGGGTPPINLYIGVGNGAGNGVLIPLTYTNVSAPASSYYLIASTSPITVAGVTRVADAVYAGGASDQIQSGRAGGVALVRASDGAYIDRVAWSRSGGAENAPNNFIETSPIVAGPNGLGDGDQLVRMSGPGSLSGGYGRAYDTDNNAMNFFYFAPLLYGHNNTLVSMPVVSGRPAYGAYVTANDGNSTAVQAAVVNPGSYSYAKFVMPSVATGTWTVVVTSGAFAQTVTGVAVTQGATTGIPNSATTPVWPAWSAYELSLTSATSGGYAQGYVYGTGSQYNTPLSSILVTAGGATTRTTSNGYFLLPVSTGSVTVTANFNFDNLNYTVDSEVGTVGLGQAVFIPPSPYIHLSQGGIITGYVTGGTGSLPNIIVQATLGGSVFSATSDSTGRFYIAVATSASGYSVSPSLDPAQTYAAAPATPLSATVTSPGSTVFAGTITVTGALGTISGTVSLSGGAITTGVLVVASQSAVPDPPPTVTAANSPALSNPYYAVTSQADGTYSLPARAGSSYNLRAYYPAVDINTGVATYTSKTLGGVTVTAGQTTGGQNFTWP